MPSTSLLHPYVAAKTGNGQKMFCATEDFSNCRFLTPAFATARRQSRLPDSDASKEEDRIQKTGRRG
jgi:hypothetical protein